MGNFANQKIKDYFFDPRKIFLIDASGALLTFVMLFFIFGSLFSVLGLPTFLLKFLGLVAFGFAVYSFICFFFFPNSWPIFLGIIALANSVYCFVSLALYFFYWNQLSILGKFYFPQEILIILTLVFFECRLIFLNQLMKD